MSFEKLPDNDKDVQKRVEVLNTRVAYFLNQLSEDFEDVVIITRKIWHDESNGDHFDKLLCKVKGDPMVTKTMVDLVGKQMTANLIEEVM